MALLVQHFTVVDSFDVDPTATIASNNYIVAGMVVGLNSSNYLSRPSASVYPLGIAGDSWTNEYQTTAYSAQLVVSAGGARRWTTNRVSDMFNEALASGKLTVYIGSGVFATDQYLKAGQTWTVGAPVYATSEGQFTSSVGSSFLTRPVGYVKAAPTSYPSGVPGADTDPVFGAATQNGTTMSLGQFLTIHLSI
jgi:hypothetical protein